MAAPVILLTGRPGIGKTTVVKKIVQLLVGNAGGFYSREVRENGKRLGFEIVTLEGEADFLAQKTSEAIFAEEVTFEGYKVNLGAINSIAVPSLLTAMEQQKVVIVDEIGPMEIFSSKFRETVQKLLDNKDARIMGTIVKRSYEFADDIKANPRVKVVELTLENRDALPNEIYSVFAP